MPGSAAPEPALRHHRSLFLSDLHLGSLGARPDLVLKFLEHNRADTYYLVGDILDLWIPPFVRGTQAHEAVIDHLRARAAEGARLVYIRGNHDPAPEKVTTKRRVPVPPQEEAMHVAADGLRYLVVHGDSEDMVIFRSHLLTRVGTHIDNLLRLVGDRLRPRARRGVPAKRRVLDRLFSAVTGLFHPRRGYERRLVELARARGADGVICGHFHRAGLHDRHGLVYANCGDWVQSFTCLAEDHGGRLHMLDGRQAPAGARLLLPEGEAVHA